MAGHIHAALMLEYAKDAEKTVAPWADWEILPRGQEGDGWHYLTWHPDWDAESQYRRRPRAIRIGAFDVPEPLRVAPAEDAQYWAVDLSELDLVFRYTWYADPTDCRSFEQGLCHATEAAAKLHAQALLSFTAQTAIEGPTSS